MNDNPTEHGARGEITFGEMLRTLRKQADFTLELLGGAIGVSAAYLSQVETGERNPPNTRRIANILRVLNAKDQQAAMVSLARSWKRRVSVSLVDSGPIKRRLLSEIARLSEDGFDFESDKHVVEAANALLTLLRNR